MDRILFIVALALLYSSPSLAADEDRAGNEFQNNLVIYNKDGSDEKNTLLRVGKHGQLTNLNLTAAEKTTEEKWINDSLDRNRSAMKTYIGPGVAPLYGTYSVLRTNGKQDGSSYVAFGFNLDELIGDETDTSYSSNNNDLSFGFGVNNTLFNIEYMMYVNEENYQISAISLGYISEF
jgi:hypothetical protein